MKWLYVHLPHFYAESCIVEFRSQQPTAIIDGQRNIVDCNENAKVLGISVDMNLNSAFCLCPNLHTHERQDSQLPQAQNRIAKIAEQFSSWVGIDSDQGVFLEIASMRRLFGTTQQLQHKLHTSFKQYGYTTFVAAAPYPATARLLAKAGICHSINSKQVHDILATIPVHFIGTDNATELKFLKMGIDTIGELYQLNRSDLAHRIDRELIDDLARVYGDKRWLPQPYNYSETFRDTIELEEEFETLLPLRFVLAQRITRFSYFLRKRQLLCQELQIIFIDREGRHHQEKLFLACPDNQVAPWHYMLNINIQRWQLKTPAITIKLKAKNFIPQSAAAFDLFSDPLKDTQRQSSILFNRLSTRLGPSSLHFLLCSNDPIPEFNTTYTQQPVLSSNKKPLNIFNYQPIWIYSKATPATLKLQRILHGPTRLETGWWDGKLQQRDYYIIADNHNVLRWIFRLPDGNFFEQGLFG